MTLETRTNPKGTVEMVVEDLNGSIIERHCFENAVLEEGRRALASSLANDIGDEYNFFISRMLFGDGGTSGGVPRFVNTNRNGLFGTTIVNKPVISNIDPNIPSQVIFTSTISYSEGNGFALNEMALQMNTGDLYSMATFADISKTSSIQITWNWRLSFV
jgi:molybdopterin-binding protein